MKSKSKKSRNSDPPALIALRRAAKKAVELARQTGTSAYVLEGGKLVDAATRRPKKKRKPTRP
jgi:hypothetical protein